MMDEGIHNIRGFTENQISDYVLGRSFYALKVLPTATGSIPKPNKKASAAEKLQYIACTMFQLGFSDGLKHYIKMASEEYGANTEEIEGEPSETAFMLSEIKYQLAEMNKAELEKVLGFIYSTKTETYSTKDGGKHNGRS